MGANLKLEIIGFDSGWGCRDYRCEDGPALVPADSVLATLRNLGIEAKWRGPLGLKFIGNHADIKTKEDSLPLTLEAVRRLCDRVMNSVEAGYVPVVIGGDHSSAIGTWSGVAAGTGNHGKLGLVWLDAHLDSHTYETSHQGKWGGWWHGQPVTAITGHGLASFRHVGGRQAKISPQHLSIIGPHSFEPAELEFVKREGIRVYFLEEVQARGFKACYEEALVRATTGTAGFGLTIDMDSFRPEDAPGVGAAEDTGLVAAEVLPVIRSVGRRPGFRALELAEFNPHQDELNKTRQLIENLIESVFS